MKQVTINELQSNVAAWISQLTTERQIVVVDQGRPVAALVPPALTFGSATLPNREERIQQRSLLPIDSATYISELRD